MMVSPPVLCNVRLDRAENATREDVDNDNDNINGKII